MLVLKFLNRFKFKLQRYWLASIRWSQSFIILTTVQVASHIKVPIIEPPKRTTLFHFNKRKILFKVRLLLLLTDQEN